jgi:hypothetical protein
MPSPYQLLYTQPGTPATPCACCISVSPGALVHSFVRWHYTLAVYHYKNLRCFNTGASPLAH